MLLVNAVIVAARFLSTSAPWSWFVEPAQCLEAVVEPRGERMLGRKPVVDAHDW